MSYLLCQFSINVVVVVVVAAVIVVIAVVIINTATSFKLWP